MWRLRDHYLSPENARKRLLASHDWLLFVGDNDTGLVLDLLQLLSPAAGSAKGRRSAPHLWLGGEPRAPLNISERCRGGSCSNATHQKVLYEMHEDWSRRCLLDWSYDTSGKVVGTRSVHCRESISWKYMSSERSEYVRFGRDYNLTDPATSSETGAGGLRITYVGTGHEDQTDATLKALVKQFDSDGVRKPTGLYVSIGSWYERAENSPPHVTRLIGSVEALATTINPRTHVFATTLGQYNRNRSVGYGLAGAIIKMGHPQSRRLCRSHLAKRQTASARRPAMRHIWSTSSTFSACSSLARSMRSRSRPRPLHASRRGR